MVKTPLPYLKAIKNSKQLYVDGKPFLILGCELHNSSSSTIGYLENIWPKIVDYNINTIFLPITWEQFEPQESVYDYELLDGILNGARKHGLHLVLLWFGSFKNGESSYVPSWVKQSPLRFPRTKIRVDGKLVFSRTLSVFTETNLSADLKAFQALMTFLKKADEQRTVLLVQVENESGVLGDSRDRCDAANKAFAENVPETLTMYVKSNQTSEPFQTRFPRIHSGTWESTFGEGENTDEIFMAWHYARYIDKIAAAGKEIYPIPMYVNAWLNSADSTGASGGSHPGFYPSGGVLPHTLDVYQSACNHIDIFSPDIYADQYDEFCALYRHNGNPLLIPEQRRDYYGAERIFGAIATRKAIGVSPFGIDSIWKESVLFKAHYNMLRQVAPMVLKAQEEDVLVGFHFPGTGSAKEITHVFGSTVARINRIRAFGAPQSGFGMIIQLAPDEFLGVGSGFMVSFSSIQGNRVEIISVDEGCYEAEKWHLTRRMNGDETNSGSQWMLASVDPDMGDFHVPIMMPANTGISRCKVYHQKDLD